jgi:hypothetical protein
MGKKNKATNDQFQARVERAAQLMGEMLPDSAVKRQLHGEFGVEWRQAMRYMALARAAMTKRSGRDRFAHVVESIAFYEAELRRSTEPMVRIKCRERLDSLLGLDAKFLDGPAQPPAPQITNITVTVNVANLSVDEIERRVEAGEVIDIKQLSHLDVDDRLRVLRRCANQPVPTST